MDVGAWHSYLRAQRGHHSSGSQEKPDPRGSDGKSLRQESGQSRKRPTGVARYPRELGATSRPRTATVALAIVDEVPTLEEQQPAQAGPATELPAPSALWSAPPLPDCLRGGAEIISLQTWGAGGRAGEQTGPAPPEFTQVKSTKWGVQASGGHPRSSAPALVGRGHPDQGLEKPEPGLQPACGDKSREARPGSRKNPGCRRPR